MMTGKSIAMVAAAAAVGVGVAGFVAFRNGGGGAAATPNPAVITADRAAPTRPGEAAGAPAARATPVADAAPAAGGAKLADYTESIKEFLVSFDMVAVPGGKLVTATGSPDGKPRTVDVKPFYMGKREVTWDEYDVFCLKKDLTPEQITAKFDDENRPSPIYAQNNPDCGFGHAGYPAISISQKSAIKYCEWLSKRTGRKYRLATEAEWEFACSGGDATAEPPKGAELQKVAWFDANSEEATHPVGKKAANVLGLHDMLGNAAEWVIAEDGKRVVKGGAFNDRPSTGRLSAGARYVYVVAWQARDPQLPKSSWWYSDSPHGGFRIVCEP